MRPNPAPLLLLLASFCLGASATQAGTVTREAEVVRLSGRIDGAAAQAVESHLLQGAHTLVVQSEGGDAQASLAIAHAMLGRDVRLVVDGYCLADCANYLFVAAGSKRLLPGALLGLQEASAAKENSGKGPAELPLERAHEAFSGHARLLRADSKLYRDAGVDRGLLRLSRELTRTSAGAPRLYFPSAATLARHGVKGIEDYPYPGTQEDLDRLAHAVAPAGVEAVGDFPAAAD